MGRVWIYNLAGLSVCANSHAGTGLDMSRLVVTLPKQPMGVFKCPVLTPANARDDLVADKRFPSNGGGPAT